MTVYRIISYSATHEHISHIAHAHGGHGTLTEEAHDSKGKHTAIYTPSTRHADAVKQAMHSHGYHNAHIHGDTGSTVIVHH